MFKYDLHHEMKAAARLKLSDEYGNAVDYLVGWTMTAQAKIAKPSMIMKVFTLSQNLRGKQISLVVPG